MTIFLSIAGWFASKIAGAGVSARASAALGKVATVLVAIGIVWAGWWLLKSYIIKGATNEANVEMLGEKDKAAGEADIKLEERAKVHKDRVAKTGDLVDEALEKGCAVGEYLASNGTNCVR